MGNSRKEKTSTKINVILQSGFTSPRIDQQDSLTIKLVEINASTFEKISLGKSVELLQQRGSYYCFYRGEILGKIPSNYNRQVESLDRSNATIVNIWRIPPTVTIKL